ncbi:hypothetical protein FHR92_004725 [Fontibacillus solani]|uniref:Uncharacterized protein n=1 Tax=Fontibacillus solani TaxID=1572857 RepID=A0A7W3SY22_9BACL|nr:hypothetical protein [Fontibacillus solani]MBA9088229.1 hypothetical protein [Fontibacillus solani]
MSHQYFLHLKQRVGKKTDEGFFFYGENGWEPDKDAIILGCLLDIKDEYSIWDIEEITEEDAFKRMQVIDY